MAPTQPFKARVNTDRAKPETNRTRVHQEPSHREPGKSKASTKRSRRRPKKDAKHVVVTGLDMDANLETISSSEDDYGSDDLDLDKPLHAIGDYLHNRKDLVSNMFQSLKHDTLSRMIPSILRDISLKQLQEKCVFELDGMSRKRIRGILSGQETHSSSGTDDSDEDVASSKAGPTHSALEPCANLPSVRSSTSLSVCGVSQTDSGSSPGVAAGVGDRMSEDNLNGVSEEINGGYCVRDVHATEMELVELELRAQALRALMKQLDDAENADSLKRNSGREENGTEEKLSNSSSPEIGGERKPTDKDFFNIHVDEDEYELANFN